MDVTPPRFPAVHGGSEALVAKHLVFSFLHEAKGTSVLCGYDHRAGCSIPIGTWRRKITSVCSHCSGARKQPHHLDNSSEEPPAELVASNERNKKRVFCSGEEGQMSSAADVFASRLHLITDFKFTERMCLLGLPSD